MSPLKIFCAGSIRKALGALADSFVLRYGEEAFSFQAGGSLELARDLLEEKSEGDLFFSADYRLLKSWFSCPDRTLDVRPAVTNEKVLAFPRGSLYSRRLTPDNWYRLLQEPGVTLAHTDPDRDPGGYRALLVLRLAESFYGQPGLFDGVYRNPSRLVLPPGTDHDCVDRLHDEGRIDFMIRYRSSLRGDRYDFMELPAEINLGSTAMAGRYAGARMTIRGQDGEDEEVFGEPILYGAALLARSSEPEAARAFLDYAFSEEGERIFRDYGFGIPELGYA